MSFTVNIYYTGKNGSARKFAEEMTASGIVDLIRAEEGNERYEYFFPSDDPETVLLIDRWKDQHALDLHHKSDMMTQIARLREKYGLHMRVERFQELEDKKKAVIRREQETDYQKVEELTRKAFWNLYMPGCYEHYLVHIMRGHEDFIPELDFVVELDGEVIGNIMYTKAWLTDGQGEKKEILTFGPVCIDPRYQREGYGKQLIEYSFEKARELGYDVIVIFGDPGNYVSRGFKSAKKYQICIENGVFPSAMLVKELVPGALDGRNWVYEGSPVMHIDENTAQQFDESLESMEKKVLPCQEAFDIHSHSVIQ